MTIKREELDQARGRAACCSGRDSPRLMDDIHPANPTCRLAAHTVL